MPKAYSHRHLIHTWLCLVSEGTNESVELVGTFIPRCLPIQLNSQCTLCASQTQLLPASYSQVALLFHGPVSFPHFPTDLASLSPYPASHHTSSHTQTFFSAPEDLIFQAPGILAHVCLQEAFPHHHSRFPHCFIHYLLIQLILLRVLYVSVTVMGGKHTDK